MQQKVSKIVWTRQARLSLNNILDYRYKDIPKARKIVRADIVNASKSITFPKQFPPDNINPHFRKILVRDYKILYKNHKTNIFIMNVVCILAESENLK